MSNTKNTLTITAIDEPGKYGLIYLKMVRAHLLNRWALFMARHTFPHRDIQIPTYYDENNKVLQIPELSTNHVFVSCEDQTKLIAEQEAIADRCVHEKQAITKRSNNDFAPKW